MKSSRLIALAAAAALIASCSRGARISGVVNDAPETEIIVSQLDVNKYKVLDTLTTDANGAFKYKLDVQKGQPEFIYLFHGDKRIASLLLQQGENAVVATDLNGNCTVTGSPETDKLLSVERDEAEFANTLASLSARLDDVDPSSPEAREISREMTKQYISYYRSRVQYIMENPKSLTVIPVLYQVEGDGLPVFGQVTDAIHFANCSDSLMTVYPESRYVKALAEEAARRKNLLEINAKLSTAEERNYPDLELPDTKGQKVKLSSLEDAKMLVVYFWSASESGQQMFNLDVMKPLYEQYHSKGLEIYAVSLDTDKTLWATSVKNQQLPWTNVCDGLGATSPSLTLYNIASVPTVYFIEDGNLVNNMEVKDEATLRRYVASRLR